MLTPRVSIRVGTLRYLLGYVSDVYFDPADGHPESLRTDAIEIRDDPLDALVNVERDLATVQFMDADLSPAQERVIETLSDRGSMDYERLADASETSTSTVYRAIAKLDRVVETVNGEIRMVDDIVRDQLASLFDTIERSADLFADRVDDVLDHGLVVEDNSPFGRWLRAHGGAIRELAPQEAPVVGGHGRAEDWLEIDLSLGQYSRDEIKRLLRQGGIAARETSAETLEQLRTAVVRYRDRDGQERTQIVAARHGGVIKAGGGAVTRPSRQPPVRRGDQPRVSPSSCFPFIIAAFGMSCSGWLPRDSGLVTAIALIVPA